LFFAGERERVSLAPSSSVSLSARAAKIRRKINVREKKEGEEICNIREVSLIYGCH